MQGQNEISLAPVCTMDCSIDMCSNVLLNRSRLIGVDLQYLGYFVAYIILNEMMVKERIYVIKGNLEPLLGRKTTFDLKISAENVQKVELEEPPDEYADIFRGTGHIKGFVHEVTVDPSVTPVTHERLRRKPYAMNELIDAELDKMLENDIIEKSPKGSPWVSYIIAVPKSN